MGRRSPLIVLGHHSHSERVVPYEKTVTHHEHRAPTDESVRLLNEMQEAARNNLIARFPSPSNDFNGEWIISRDHFDDNIRFVCRYDINGTTHQFETKQSVCVRKIDDILKAVCDEFCLHLVKRHLSGPLFRSVAKELRGLDFGGKR